MRSNMKAVATVAAVLVVAMTVFCIIPATDADTVTEITADDFKALADASGKVVLSKDYALTTELVLEGTIDLNLAGHTVTNTVANVKDTITVSEGASLTVSDSVGGGKVQNVTFGKSAIVNDGTLIVNGGSFDALGTVIVDNADATISAGTFSDMSIMAMLGAGAVIKVDVTRDTVGAPVFLAAGDANIDVDLNGNTYTFTGDAVGSETTKTQVMHLERGNTVNIHDGDMRVVDVDASKMFIQNYCDLTLDNVQIDATSVTTFVISSNNGTVNVLGNTGIANASGVTAIEASWWPSVYPDGTDVVIETTGTITGKLELGFYGDKNTVENPMPLPSKTLMTIRNVVLDGSVDIVKGDTHPDFTTGLTTEAVEAMVKQNVQVLGGTFGPDAVQFALDHVVSGADVKLTGAIAIEEVMIPYGTTITLVEGTEYTGKIIFQAKPALAGVSAYAGTTDEVLTLAGVTAGTDGFSMDSDGISGSVSAGQLTVAGDVEVRSKLTMADGARIVVPVGASLSIGDSVTVTGGDIVNYGTVEVDGTLASDVDNQEGATVDAAVDAVISGTITGEGTVEQVKPTISDLPDQTCVIGGSISVPFTVSDGASVKLSGAHWASISNGKIVGTPTSTGTWIVVATPAVGDNVGESKHFVVVVSSSENDVSPGPVTDEGKDKGFFESLDTKTIMYIVIAILVILAVVRIFF